MKRKILSCMLSICLILTMMPSMAWATGEGTGNQTETTPEPMPVAEEETTSDTDPGTLDLTNGSITITATGYTQGDAAAETAYTGDYVITQSNADTVTANTITVNGIASGKTITLSGINIESANSPILANATVKLQLLGQNTIKLTGAQKSALHIAQNKTVTLCVPDGKSDTDGSLIAEVTERYTSAIGASDRAVAGYLVVNSGTITAKCTHRAAWWTEGTSIGPVRKNMQGITINGGIVNATTVNSNPMGVDGATGNQTPITVNGGYLYSNTGFSSNLTVNGGNMKTESGKEPAITGKTLTKLYVVWSSGAMQKNTDYTVTVVNNGSEKAWKTRTDSDGIITTYLAEGENIKNGQKLPVGWLIGNGSCVCDTAPLTFIDVPTEKDVYTANAVVDVTARGECNMPIHQNITVDVAIDSVTLEGSDTPVAESQISNYASYDSGKLTLKPAGNTDNYTVKLRATRGGEGETPVYHEIKAWASNTVNRKLNIANGAITVTGVSGTNNVKYTQGSNTFTVDKDSKVIITGQHSSNNVMISTDASVILKNLQITGISGEGNNPIRITNNATATLWLEGENKLTTGTYRGSLVGLTSSAVYVEPGSHVIIDSESGDLVNADIDTAHYGDKQKGYAGSLYAATSGTRGGASAIGGDYSSDPVMACGTITIRGGNVAAKAILGSNKNASGAAIGAGYGEDPVCGNITISGGNVRAKCEDGSSTPGGAIRSGKSNLTITGGVVYATAPNDGWNGESAGSLSTRGGDITIGVEGASDDSLYVYAGTTTTNVGQGNTAAPAISVANGGSINILSGTVFAESTGHGPAIGEGAYSTSTDVPITINISGGDVSVGLADETNMNSGAAIGIGGNNYNNNIEINITGGTVNSEDLDIGVRGNANNAQSSVNISGDAELNIENGDLIGDASVSGNDTTVNISGNVSRDVEVSGGSTITVNGNTVTVPDGVDSITVSGKDFAEVEASADSDTVTLPAGSSVTANGTTSTIPEGTGLVTMPSEQMSDMTSTEDGSVTFPTDTVIQREEGTVVTLPEGGSVSADGETVFADTLTVKTEGAEVATTITAPAGESVTVTNEGTVKIPAGSSVGDTVIPEDAGTVTIPSENAEAVGTGADGSVQLPAGTVIERADGSTITLPTGGSLDSEGGLTTEGTVIVEKADGNIEVTDSEGNKTVITVPEGEKAEVGTDGTIIIPEGTKVTEGEGENQTVTTVPQGGSLDSEGSLTTDGSTVVEKADGSVEITDGEGNKTVITVPEGEKAEVGTDGTITVPEGTKVTEGEGENQTVTTVPQGGSVDSNNGEVTSETGSVITQNPDGSVKVTDPEDNVTIITPAEGKDVTVEADGSITLPEGTKVTEGEGEEQTVTTLPQGGSLDSDGSLTTEGGTVTEKADGSVEITDSEGNTTVLTPPAGEEAGDIIVNADGSVIMPEGTKVTEGEGENQTVTTVPEGGSLDSEGGLTTEGTVIVEKADGSVEVTDSEDNVTIITPAEGKDVIVEADGTIIIPEGTKVTEGEGEGQTTTTVPEGGSLDNEGSLTTDGGTIVEKADGSVEVTDKEGNTATIIPTEGSSAVVNPDGTIVLPEGGKVGDVELPPDIGLMLPYEEAPGVSKDETGTVQLPEGIVVEKEDGSVTTLPEGGSMDSEGNITSETGSVITENPDGSVEITDSEGNKTVITVPEGEKAEVGTDGTITVPEGTKVTEGEGENQTVTTVPQGGSMDSEGNITSETGSVITENPDGSVKVTDAEGKETIITPAEGKDVTVSTDGTIIMPEGTVITESEETITLPEGGIMGAETGILGTDGTVIVEKADGNIEVTDSEGNKTVITVPEGEKAEVETDGSITLPEGTKVTEGEGENQTVTTVPEGGSLDSEGGLTTEGTVIVEKADGNIEVTDSEGNKTVITVPKGEKAEVGTDGTITVPEGTKVTEGEGENQTVTTVPQGGSLDSEGSLTTDGSTVVEKADGSVEITDGEGNKTVITVPEGEKAEVGTDGTITVPEGTKVTEGEGENQTVTTVPQGGSVDSNNGEVTSETGSVITQNPDGSVKVTDPEDNVTIITPAEGKDVTVEADGSITMPEGTKVTEGKDETQTVTTVPQGGGLDDEGNLTTEGSTIVEKADGSVEVTDSEDNVTIITPAEGKDVIVEADGTIIIPEGTKVTEGEGEGQTTTTVPEGGSLDNEGSLTTDGTVIVEKADGNIEVTDGEGNKTVITVPEGEKAEVGTDGTITLPEGTKVTEGEGEGQTTTTVPEGGSLDGNTGELKTEGSTIVEQADGKVEITDSEGNTTTIIPPEGEKVQVGTDGTVEMPEGTVVTDKDGKDTTLESDGVLDAAKPEVTTPVYTIVFEGNGATGGATEQLTADYGKTVNLTENGFTREGYIFNGWNTSADGTGTAYADKAEVKNLAAKDGAEVKLYAQWKVVTYTITYAGVAGAVNNNPATTYTIESAAITLAAPAKAGYVFTGWTWAGQTTPVKSVTIPKGSYGNKAYTANWTPVVYTITYGGVAGAVNSNPATYTIESAAITLTAPAKAGYVFTGWTYAGQTAPVKTVVIPKGSMGNKAYTANFMMIPTAPAKVTTALYGYDDIKVTWSAATGATSYQVYMKKGSGAYKLATTTSSLSYKAKNLADGAKYTFKVVAYNGTLAGGEKASSAIYTLKKVTGVKVVKSGSKVKVSWKNIEGETGYQISKMTKKKGTQKKPTTYKTTKGKYKKLAAAKGKTYYYKVRAYKTVNGKKIYGPWSAVKKFKRK